MTRTPRTTRRPRRLRAIAATLAVGASLAAAQGAMAFDTSSHADITRDALATEGFGTHAADVARVENWFVDLYENSKDLPHSGHAGVMVTLFGGGYGDREHWPQAVVDAADRTHFDSTTGTLSTTAGLAAEWDRLARNVRSMVTTARQQNDPLSALAVLGISLHQVQDFYAHTNWVEPSGTPGFDGPGWAARGQGSSPTWFDVPDAVRAGARLYSAGNPGIPRGHGVWRSDGNASLATQMNKDWPGRPLYDAAYGSAYFATRQWVQAVRGWVGDDAFWRRMQAYANGPEELAHDVRGSEAISTAAGHWQGQGEPCRPNLSLSPCGDNIGPGGRLLDLRSAISSYFEGRPKTRFRAVFERLVVPLAGPAAPGVTAGPVPSSAPVQAATQFVRLRAERVDEVDDMDLLAIDQAEFSLEAGIAGQRFRSATVFGSDHLAFNRPAAPFTFIKAAPRGGLYDEPLRSLVVEVSTGNVSGAGTDDDIFVRVAPGRSFQLDKRAYDDFERGDRDTYSAPIDDAALEGMTVGDIRYIEIAKSPDGRNGAWNLAGVRVIVNGRTVAQDLRVGRWLSGGSRTWQSPSFHRVIRRTTALPVWLRLTDVDGGLYGANDHADLEPLGFRKDPVLTYVPSAEALAATTAGGSTYAGRSGDSKQARLRYRIDTVVPVPPPAATPAAVPASRP